MEYFGHSSDNLDRNMPTFFIASPNWSDLHIISPGNVEKNPVWTIEMVVVCVISWRIIENGTSRSVPPCGNSRLAARSGLRVQRENT